MKLCFVKLGYRFAWNSSVTTGTNAELIRIIQLLHDHRPDIELHFMTGIFADDENPEWLIMHDIDKEWQNVNNFGFDALLIHNGNLTFFAGKEYPYRIKNHALINIFKGPVFYIHMDYHITLKQCWSQVEKKRWRNNWKKEELYIQRDDIIYITESYNTQYIHQMVNRGSLKVPIKLENIHYFRFDISPIYFYKKFDIIENPSVDLIYGGTMRSNRRITKMGTYFYGYDPSIIVELFGKLEKDEIIERYEELKVQNIKKLKSKGKIQEAEKLEKLTLNDINKPIYSEALEMDKYLSKMNNAIATINLNDKESEGVFIPPRIYEAISVAIVVFVDIDTDPFHIIYKDDSLLESFNYIHSPKELENKLLYLKNNPSFRKEIIKRQFDLIDKLDDRITYINKFVDIIKNNI